MAQARYYSEDELAERQPLDGSAPYPPPHRHYRQPHAYQQDAYDVPPPQFAPRGHQDPSFARLRSQRRYDQEPPNGGRGAGPYAAPTANTYGDSATPLRSSPQRQTDRRSWGQGTSYPPQAQRPSPQSTVTPGADNFGNAAAGGMAGIALTIAEQNARESGLNAIHNQQSYQQGQGYADRGMLAPDYHAGDTNSHSSLQGMSTASGGSGYSTPGQRTPSRIGGEVYTDDPYQNLSRHVDSRLGVVNPLDIADDGDDGLEYGRRGPRTSMLSLGSNRSHGAAAAGGAAAGGVLGGLVGGNVNNQYAPVHAGASSDGASGASGLGSSGERVFDAGKGNGKKWKIAIIAFVVIAIIAAIVLGVLFGAVFRKSGNHSNNAGSSSTAAGDIAANGDLNADSSEVKALMDNPDLRKVFPGMDYTPLNTQYPDCMHNPPSQNNITRDLAVLSQLTSVVRLYGTDCNQTQMLIHAVDQLGLKDKVKIWLGVWQDANATTNARQLSQMWDILEEYDESYFKGVIVANEILFREQMTITALGSLLEEVRTNLTARGLGQLPVATSDLGDKWDATLASQSDAIMANIHPFFAGARAAEAADWTMYFWGNKTTGFLKRDSAMNIIAETGWPSQGGMACGTELETDCPDRAVAGIDELNTFMEDWVCRALDEGTEYLWFEAFDEPWKIMFNTDGKEWEDHWGLMTVDRKLKDGVKIPDCGGKRVA
ncbi:glycoside hydrolase family 17 protein [Parathielavia hyrcaniae]|uniref:glucan endo-1,3-beta-D-glucosidase n=1 Tax=Parathielavia hyrcaniae TaxID=113614 RepID=A0AAN6Q3N6_9PEZI|nr:glycoside hydrolase family 17 protein [Parathielavia hyrcaniae]